MVAAHEPAPVVGTGTAYVTNTGVQWRTEEGVKTPSMT